MDYVPTHDVLGHIEDLETELEGTKQELDTANLRIQELEDTVRYLTGAERYFREQMEDPGYRAAYDEARAALV